MKKISLLGVFMGLVAGVLVSMVAGSWLLWLGLGLATGLVLGSAGTNRGRADISARREDRRAEVSVALAGGGSALQRRAGRRAS